jgi:hypothetical protein
MNNEKRDVAGERDGRRDSERLSLADSSSGQHLTL